MLKQFLSVNWIFILPVFLSVWEQGYQHRCFCPTLKLINFTWGNKLPLGNYVLGNSPCAQMYLTVTKLGRRGSYSLDFFNQCCIKTPGKWQKHQIIKNRKKIPQNTLKWWKITFASLWHILWSFERTTWFLINLGAECYYLQLYRQRIPQQA